MGKGQEKQGGDAVRIRTELVQIEFVVKDQKGNLIPDLRREDVEVLEDGNLPSLENMAGELINPAGVYAQVSQSIAHPIRTRASGPRRLV